MATMMSIALAVGLEAARDRRYVADESDDRGHLHDDVLGQFPPGAVLQPVDRPRIVMHND